MAETLKHLAEHCHGDHRPHCPILETLGNVGADEAKPADMRRFEKIGMSSERAARRASGRARRVPHFT